MSESCEAWKFVSFRFGSLWHILLSSLFHTFTAKSLDEKMKIS